MKVKLAVYLAAFFAEHGIRDCFMVTGGGAMHLDDAIGHEARIRCTFNHHEQACAVAAEAYTRMTGKLPLVCVTSGPGGTNAITGVMGGWLDSIPMFVVSGQVKRETTIWSCPELGLRQLGDQEFDIVHSVANMTKYAVMVTEPDDIAYHLEKALFLSTHGRGGPVWLDIPLDVQGAQIDPDSLRHFDPAAEGYVSVPKPERSTIRTILQKISEANAPLLLVGTGVRLANAEEELLRVIEKLKIPVVTAWNANDTVAFDNAYYAGMPGTVGTRAGNFAVQNCDLLLSLGCRLNIRMIGYNRFSFAEKAYKIIVDIDEKELRKPTVHADMPVCADVKDVLCGLLEEPYLNVPAHGRFLAWCRDLLSRYPVVEPCYHADRDAKLNPYVCIDTLFSLLSPDDRVVCGNGSACVITFQAAKIKQGQRMFTNSGCAAMGYGLPGALGVAVSDNTRRTVCIDGDGSIMMNVQELATIAHNRLNVKIILLNNNGYHSIRQTQTNLFKPPFVGIDPQSGVGFPDFGLLARAFGLDYYRADKETDCADVLRRALDSERACIVEAVVDPTQNFAPKSSSRVLPDGRIVSAPPDDMAPFLDRAEYNAIHFE